MKEDYHNMPDDDEDADDGNNKNKNNDNTTNATNTSTTAAANPYNIRIYGAFINHSLFKITGTKCSVMRLTN